MPEIRLTLLREPRNGWLLAEPSELVADVLVRLKEAGGAFAWHLVVDFGGGDLRAIRFDALLAQADRPNPPGQLGDYELPHAKAVERTSMGTGAAVDLARQQPEQLLVVPDGGRPVGVINEGQTLGADTTPVLGGTAEPGGAIDDSHPDYVVIGGVRLDRRRRVEAAASPGDGGGGPHGRAFTAQPALAAPDQVAPEGRFSVEVGFRRDRDPALSRVTGIAVTPARPDDTFQVTLITDGAWVVPEQAGQPPRQTKLLAMDFDARVTFTCQAHPEVHEIYLTVEYVYQAQVVGTATRRVAVGADARLGTRRQDPCRVSAVEPEAQTDLLLTITRSRARPGFLQWTIMAPRPAIQIGPLVTSLEDAREFAALILQELKTQEYRGPFAAQILANKGQDIADVMPLEFFDALERVHAELGRAPTLLLLTDETYVPWELALLDPPLDPARPPYLGAQTIMGRWVRHDKVIAPPPLALDVTRLTAVAAGYGLGTDLAKLKYAVDEQAWLHANWQAEQLSATRKDLEPLVLAPKQPGHLIHFAVHGLSDPEGNDQALLLADKTRLLPSALAGRYRCGEVPPFSFVFLNACQVGTAANCLGQAAGFPGDLIRGGALGFIAPLWDVDDALARQIAERFYTATLGQNQPVGEVLHAERAHYDRAGSTTPLAYIYYGHPKLKLKRPATDG